MNIFSRLPLALDITNLSAFVSQDELAAREPAVRLYDGMLRKGTCLGNDFTGWLAPDHILQQGDMEKICQKAQWLRNNSDVLLVIGIGGSYLGARAVIEALSDTPEKVVYAGQSISAPYMTGLRKKLQGKRVAINVISKSGTTTEPAIALRLFEDLVSDKSLMAVTTDRAKGALLEYANSKGIDTFVVPDNIGGRYSVLSAVGLLPIAYAGVDIKALTEGAARTAEQIKDRPFTENPAYIYAAARHILSQKGYGLEIFSAFEPQLFYMAEWWKQLYGESEGKENMGVFPASCMFSTDLHSLGQYIQQGRRNLFETFVMVDDCCDETRIPSRDENTDQLNYLAGKMVADVNQAAYEATARAHTDGGVPNMTVMLKDISEASLGALIYFYEIACGLCCLMAGVNPFNQPGVEAYKKYMFRILGKPGYEAMPRENVTKKLITF